MATDHGKELESSGVGEGIAGKAEIFTTRLSELSVGKALRLRNFNAHVIELNLNIPFNKQADGTVPVLDGLIGSTFLKKSQAVISYQDNQLYIRLRATERGPIWPNARLRATGWCPW